MAPQLRTQIIPFNFEDHAVRTVVDPGGELWFVGKDVAEALGYTNHKKALGDHCKGVPKRYPLQTAGGMQEFRVISEPDLFRLIVSSKLPSAEKFERWVFEKVLPTIRKTGSYTTAKPPKLPSQYETVRTLLLMGKDMGHVKGVNESLAMAYTLDTIERVTGLPTNLLRRALPSVEPQDAATLNATQVGEPLSMNARAVNLILAQIGFQTRGANNDWQLSETGTIYGECKPFHRNGHSGYEVRWKPSVVEIIRNHLNPAQALSCLAAGAGCGSIG